MRFFLLFEQWVCCMCLKTETKKGVVLLTESEPVPSVIPLEHHLLPLLQQLSELLLDLTRAVIQSHFHSSIIKHLSPHTGYYPPRICIVK